MMNDLGALRNVSLLLSVADERPTPGKFAGRGIFVLALERWIHFFESPRSGESILWEAPDDVLVVVRGPHAACVLCSVRGGRSYELGLVAGVVVAHEVTPLNIGSFTSHGERDAYAVPSSAQLRGLLFVSDTSTRLADVAAGRQAHLCEGFSWLIDVDDDDATIVIVRGGHVLIAEIDYTNLNWMPLRTPNGAIPE